MYGRYPYRMGMDKVVTMLCDYSIRPVDVPNNAGRKTLECYSSLHYHLMDLLCSNRRRVSIDDCEEPQHVSAH